MSRSSVLALLAVLAFGCDDDPGMVVDLVTDFGPGAEFESVRTERLGDRGQVEESRIVGARSDIDYVRGARIAELPDLAAGPHTVRVTLLDGAGQAVMSRSVRVQVYATHAVTVVITRSCRDVTCPAPGGDPRLSECLGGRCVDPTCRPEEPDSCLPPACGGDGDCAPRVGCAVGRCSAGECLFADEGSCGAGFWCHPEEGCLVYVEPPDAGQADAGGRDGGGGDGGTCVPRTCEELDLDCGTLVQCGGVEMDCGLCTPPDTCGGGGAENRCGNGDVTGPTVDLVSGPPDPTRDATATFVFTADDGPGVGVDYVECRVDTLGFAPCTSPHEVDVFAQRAHAFEVRAIDRLGNVGPVVRHDWTLDATPPELAIDPIGELVPATYTATEDVGFSFSCTDFHSACAPSTVSCRVDGVGVACGMAGGSVAVGYSGDFAFGAHTLEVRMEDAAGNEGSAEIDFTVTRCAEDMQFPGRTSNGLTRGGCCAGLVVSSWMDFSFGFWHPRGDGSCRPASDYNSRSFEGVWGGGSCLTGQTTWDWLQGNSLPGCASAAGRAACIPNQSEAQIYCGTDAATGTQTPFHGRASEGWHPAPAAGCSTGVMSSSLLMERYGAHNVCFYNVDTATDRGSIPASEGCNAGLTRFCRTNPVDSDVACVCGTADPYAADGRG